MLDMLIDLTRPCGVSITWIGHHVVQNYIMRKHSVLCFLLKKKNKKKKKISFRTSLFSSNFLHIFIVCNSVAGTKTSL